MDLQNKYSFESNIAMLCAIILVIFVLVCCRIIPIIRGRWNERSNIQEIQIEEAIQMEQLGGEHNPGETSCPFENEQIQLNRVFSREDSQLA